MNPSTQSSDLARQRLVQLLDYVSHQSQDTQKIQYEIQGSRFYSHVLAHIRGLKILNHDEQWWFQIERLQLEPMPQPLESLSTYIYVTPDEAPHFDFSALNRLLTLQSVTAFNPLEYKIAPDLMAQIAIIQTLFDAFKHYAALWQQWKQEDQERRASIAVYDTLFSWNTVIQLGGSGDGEELVAGFGLIDWILPSTHKSYSYPLLTIPLDMEIEENGLLRVGAKETRSTIEMDAILLEDDLPHSGKVKLMLKEYADNGRSLGLFESETYSDLMSAFVANIFSRGQIIDIKDRASPSKELNISAAAVLFSRPKRNSILNDDIELLKNRLNDESVRIPEQPLSLVTELNHQVNHKQSYSFRGRSGLEGSGFVTQELYFPLPYNKEQITIVQNLLNSSGVVVQGPPGTGKTHSIANIICHYLANGKKVLVTAQQPHVLKTVHEKIPDELKPLVVSRIGSSKESKQQLESSIDFIVQKVTQMNPSEVQQTIQTLTQQIDHHHAEMALIDRNIYNFAEKHYQNIEVDGHKKLPMQIVETLLAQSAAYAWLDDPLTLESKDQFPFSDSELMRLRDARKRVGTYLSYLHTRQVPEHTTLIDAVHLKRCHDCIVQKEAIELALEQNQNHLFKANRAVTELEQFKAWLTLYLDQLRLNLADAASWQQQFFTKINTEDKALELEIYTQLIAEVQPLLDYRKILLTEPIVLNFEVQPNSKEYEALQRGAETGKPFTWYHFGSNDIQELFKSISVSGKYPTTSDEWRNVKHYVDQKQLLNRFMSKWNSIAAQLDIPLIEYNGRSIDDILKEFMHYIGKTQSYLAFKAHYIDLFNQHYLTIFNLPKSFSFYGQAENITDLIQLLEQMLKVIDLNHYQQQLDEQKHALSGFDHVLVTPLKTITAQVGTQHFSDAKLNEYADALKTLTQLNNLHTDFDLIQNASDRLQQTNAIKLSHAIAHVAYTDQLEDPVLPQTFRDAWQWKRLEHYINTISNTQQLEDLYITRQTHEKNLSRAYAQLAANKTWLALAQNASEKTLVALQRYKIAVQKIGKNTGKNAPRYRKEAQIALKEATTAIPCWVMSHFQVSESMPAEPGLFDLVIVDEASQSSIDALPVLLRAKKLLVVGDNKQVSPSNVGLASAQIDVLRHRYLHGQPHAAFLTPDMSLYDMASSIYESSVMLLEHFRCHPAIIAYSNKNFYDNRIKPMRLSKQSEQLSPALVAIYTPQGYRESRNGKHINRIEAQAIIAEMKQIFADQRYAQRSIGVISLLGVAQAEFIQSEALNAFGAAILSQVQFACGDASAFQGAERDIIFLSMVADPENCHALSRLEHEQRFNVAASRARERMYLVHSLHRDHVSHKDLRLNLIQHFYEVEENQQISFEKRLTLCESEFEKSVFTVLHEMGYKVTPQVKVGSYRIDLVVESEGDQRLAVECDGDSYHGPEQWHADMLRQRALERAGWTFWRCFASSWAIEREQKIASLVDKLNAMGIQPTHGKGSLIQDTQQKIWTTIDERWCVIDTAEQP